jgi:hypothetical protein
MAGTRESACAVLARRVGPRGHGAAWHSHARAHSASKTRVNALMAHPYDFNPNSCCALR